MASAPDSPESPSSPETGSTFGISVYVLSAQDLPKGDDRFGLCDPVVTVSLIDEKGFPLKDFEKQTEVKENTLNPEWREVLTLSQIPTANNGPLEIAVYDFDSVEGSDFIGGYFIPAEIVFKIGQRQMEPLGYRGKLEQRPVPGGENGSFEPDESRLQGALTVVLGPANLDVAKLLDHQINPSLSTSTIEAFSSSSHSFSKSAASTLGGRLTHGTVRGRTLRQEREKEQKEEEEEKRSEKDETETPEKAERRSKIRDEIISTERSYVQSLSILNSEFVQPLKSCSGEVGLAQDQIAHLVSNLETLCKVHETFLQDMTVENADLPAVILKYADYFKMYTTYLNGYEKTLSTLNALRAHKKFQDFLVECRKRLTKTGSGLDLMSYMIMPVQRVPRYVLLLRELRKNTPSALPGFNTINEALMKTKTIAAHINESKRQMENMSKLIEIQNKISGSMGTTILQPARRLIREGQLQEISSKGLFGSVKANLRIFFLFNDILLWTTTDYKFKGVMNLAAASLNTDVKKPILEITTATKELSIQFKDEGEKKQWTTDLSEVVADLQDKRNEARQRKRELISRTKKNTAHENRLDVTDLLTGRLHSLSVSSRSPTEQEQDDDDREISISRNSESISQLSPSDSFSAADMPSPAIGPAMPGSALSARLTSSLSSLHEQHVSAAFKPRLVASRTERRMAIEAALKAGEDQAPQ